MKENIENLIKDALKTFDLPEVEFSVERPADMEHGDWATNVAMVVAKDSGKNPRELAEEMKDVLMDVSTYSEIEKVEVAGPGFINFHLKRDFFSDQIARILAEKENYGKNEILTGKNVMVEYTDPNPFKIFHVGHLMNNTIGEAVSRIIEFSGAETKRANYQGDVGMHVASAIWGMKQLGNEMPAEGDTLSAKAEFLGKAYAHGASGAKENTEVLEEVKQTNIRIYKKTDEEINNLYQVGREWSLAYFEEIYEMLGTKFDYYFFESQTGEFGKSVVLENVGEVFEEGEGGAIIYTPEEEEKLHTRVFVNSEGIPTYEAKELGLAKIKHDEYPYDLSIVTTGNEVKDYFRVVMSAMKKVFPELFEKTYHIAHGMLRLPSGKMSSRTGDVVAAMDLIGEIKEKVKEKVAESGKVGDHSEELEKQIAVSAIKYSILKQSSGKDIVFEFDKALSFEGDSGPYLQYTHARIVSLLERARSEGIVWESDTQKEVPENAYEVEKILERFPETVERAQKELEPHYITTYLTELAGAFNSFYGQEKIVDKDDPFSPYKLAVSEAVAQVMKNGLWLLGIEAPERM